MSGDSAVNLAAPCPSSDIGLKLDGFPLPALFEAAIAGSRVLDVYQRRVAFIAPALVKAAVEGRLSRGIGVANLRDAPAEWSLQFERLGLAQP